MKKMSVVFLALALLVGLGVSNAWAGNYVSGNLGAVFVEDADWDDHWDSGEFTFDTGLGLTGSLGNTFANGVRGEIELGYRTNDLDEVKIDGYGKYGWDGDVSTLSLMGNVYVDFPLGQAVTPFIGGGLGFANITVDIDDVGDDDDNVFAYQFILGAGIDASQAVTLDLQYRYFATSDPEFGDEFNDLDTEYATHNFMVGVRYSF